jgi:hypothetical protein
VKPPYVRSLISIGEYVDDSDDELAGLSASRAESVLFRSSFSGLTMRYLDLAACADRAKIRSRIREVRLDNEFEEGSGVPWSTVSRPAAMSMDVRTRWYVGASRSGAAFIGVARIRGVASSSMCLTVCGNLGLFGEYRRLALEASLFVFSVPTDIGVPRSDADLTT